jgi:UDP-N-acetylglucosamine 2-epimerase (non-hydrolysing)
VTTILHAVGTRPNLVKMAPVIEALEHRSIVRQVLVHTGQHYDSALSDDILVDLELRRPDRFLGVGSGTHAEQVARTMLAFEHALAEERPDLVVVAGDVNSTLACALTAAKCGIPVAHVEAGLRSFDWSMPEELNRVLTDRLSAYLFTHSPEAAENLAREGIAESSVYYVGNTMIDTLRKFERRARERAAWRESGLDERAYVLITLHRPSNVDDPVRLSALVEGLIALATRIPVVFPVHPRTRARLESSVTLRRLTSARDLHLLEPLGYLDFLSFEAAAGAIVTDSGGVQEEASALGVPCYTFRRNTERPVTVTHGTNAVVGDDPDVLAKLRPSPWPPAPAAIPLWDGHAGERVADVLAAAPLGLQREGTASG